MSKPKKKHILFFSNHLRGPKGAAGARSWHQAKCLSESYRLTIVIPGIDPVTSRKVTADTYEGLNKNNTKVFKVWTTENSRSNKLSRALFFLTAMFSQLYRGFTARNIDLVLTMSLPVTLLFTALIVSKARRVPLVVDVRDLPFETANELGYIKNQTILRVMKWIENFSLKQADKIITNSPRYKPYLIEYGVSEEKVIIAPIGYDDFPPPENSLIDSWRSRLEDSFKRPPKLLALYAGTIGYAFPIEEILEGAKVLSTNTDIGFVFLGDGQRLAFFKEFSEKNSINAIFLGRIPKYDVHAICRGVDLCLYPAAAGNFSSAILGNKVFDYLGAEKPIIYLGNDSAVSDIIQELNAGPVIPLREPELFARKVMNLLENPSQMDRFSIGASGYRKAGYTAKNSAIKLKSTIDAFFQRDITLVSYRKVIIIGAPRSGTNMLRDILCSLDGVGTWPCDEINYIWKHGNASSNTDELTPEMASAHIKKYIRSQFDTLAKKNKLNFIVEKTCANSLRVGFVDQVLPDAHYVFIVRNGMDVVASANLRWKAKLDIPYLLKKARYVPLLDLPYYSTRYLWNRLYRIFSRQKRLAFWGPQLNDMKTLLEKHTLNEICAIQWQRCIQNSLRDFEGINQSRISKVSYESFVQSPSLELAKILTDIGIEADTKQIETAVSDVSGKSVNKWKGQIIPDDANLLGKHINQTMSHLGYAKT